jgi:probable phosphomutase (TIGR03848 family)
MARKKTQSPASTLIIMVRHGKTPSTGKLLPGRAKGLHLSDTGIQEALVVAERLSKIKKVAAIYASPLERARETAAPIAKALKQKVIINKGLLECDFGDWTGEELAKLMKLPEWSNVQRAPSTFRFPKGESFTEMQSRMVGALDDIRAKHPGEIVVCVSHADPIKAAVAHAMGTHLDLFQRIVISTCSVSAVAYSMSGPVVLTVNSTGGSLSELRPS